MRRITVYFICLFMMLGNIKFVSADTEINRIMNNKNQDVLFVGSVTYVSDNYFVLSAKDYINTESTSEAIAKRTEDHRYVIMKNENIEYTSSYHEKTTVEEGDHVIASLKKTKGKWTISNGLYETDSDDYQTLAVKAYNKNPDVQSIIHRVSASQASSMSRPARAASSQTAGLYQCTAHASVNSSFLATSCRFMWVSSWASM